MVVVLFCGADSGGANCIISANTRYVYEKEEYEKKVFSTFDIDFNYKVLW